MKKILSTLAVVAAVTSAHAVPTLYLSDGVNTVTISDGGFGDLNGATGAVTFIGSIGSWTLNVSTGQSAPFLGTDQYPYMDLNSVNTSFGGGSLTIRWSDDGFGATPVGSALARIGGTVSSANPGNSITFNTYADAANTIHTASVAGATLLTSQSFGPGAFSGTAGGPALAGFGSPYSLTEEIIITHVGGTPSSTSFNAEFTVPDGGSMLTLLGMGLLSLGFIGRNRKSN